MMALASLWNMWLFCVPSHAQDFFKCLPVKKGQPQGLICRSLENQGQLCSLSKSSFCCTHQSRKSNSINNCWKRKAPIICNLHKYSEHAAHIIPINLCHISRTHPAQTIVQQSCDRVGKTSINHRGILFFLCKKWRLFYWQFFYWLHMIILLLSSHKRPQRFICQRKMKKVNRNESYCHYAVDCW